MKRKDEGLSMSAPGCRSRNPDHHSAPIHSVTQFYLTSDGPFGPAHFSMVFTKYDHLWPVNTELI